MTNIWIAASDGKLDQVKHFIESENLSPNAHDPNSYTPMHAAASYGHLDVLDYLISKGGDVNIRDEDGDTPLYTVEDIQTATFLVEHGARIDAANNEGVSPIDHLREDFPLVAAFLHARLAPSSPLSPAPQPQPQPSQHQQNAATEQLTSQLMADVQHILTRADADGREPDDAELHAAVSRAVLSGVLTGFDLSQNADDGRDESAGHRRPDDEDEASRTKRARTEGGQ